MFLILARNRTWMHYKLFSDSNSSEMRFHIRFSSGLIATTKLLCYYDSGHGEHEINSLGKLERANGRPTVSLTMNFHNNLRLNAFWCFRLSRNLMEASAFAMQMGKHYWARNFLQSQEDLHVSTLYLMFVAVYDY